MSYAEDLYKIFAGNKRSFGQFTPKNGKMFTEKREVSIDDFRNHLEGNLGIGIVPILDDQSCLWGAIDIDNHGDKVVNIDSVVKAVWDRGLPLVPCRSKSGGVHLYLFGADILPAKLVRLLLTKWAKDLGFGGSEVFPKQVSLRDNELGNWINLPYFEADKTSRYAMKFDNGNVEKISLDDFIIEAKHVAVSKEVLLKFAILGHEEAPPCIQRMIQGEVERGYRNESIYNLTIYFRRAFSDTNYREYVYDLNMVIFDKPLPFEEVKKTVESASRREYKYKCMEEPCKGFCSLDTCMQRKWGISKEDSTAVAVGLPEFSKLSIIKTDPPLWELTVESKKIVLTTKQLRCFQSVAEMVMEKLLRVIPMMKNGDWMNKLSSLMQDVEEIETPDDASVPGIIKSRLQEFLEKADLSSNGTDTAERDLMERGLPVVQELGTMGDRVVMFKGTQFINFLKRTKSEETKGADLWTIMRSIGVSHRRVRIGGNVRNVWLAPLDDYNRTILDPEYGKPKTIEEMEQEEKDRESRKLITKMEF